MNNAFGMSCVESIGDFNAQVQHAIQIEWAILNQVFERLPTHVFHNDEQLAFVITDLVDGADIGMIER